MKITKALRDMAAATTLALAMTMSGIVAPCVACAEAEPAQALVQEQACISADEAAAIALADQGVSPEQAHDLSVELCDCDEEGIHEYRVLYRANDLEHSYDIDPYTGDIL